MRQSTVKRKKDARKIKGTRCFYMIIFCCLWCHANENRNQDSGLPFPLMYQFAPVIIACYCPFVIWYVVEFRWRLVFVWWACTLSMGDTYINIFLIWTRYRTTRQTGNAGWTINSLSINVVHKGLGPTKNIVPNSKFLFLVIFFI